jgi:hypothetical protein
MGYFNISAQMLMEDLKDYHFEDADILCNAFNSMMQQGKAKSSPQDPFPWLAPDDWRRDCTDEQILDKQLDLSKSDIGPKEKKKLIGMCKHYKKAFSLRDEVGECPEIKVHIDLHDTSPFFVRPFGIAEDDKPHMDWQMQRLVHLGVLTKNSTSHTSPVMLISRKVTADKRAVVDFRVLNTRVIRRNTTTPLMRDILSTLGRSTIQALSCIDFKDAFHSLKLDEESKEYCGIVPYFGAPCYRFERMPMGLSISPAMWIEYVNILLQNVSYRQNYIAIMDDLLIFGKKHNHMEMIEDLLKNTVKHGLKISPKKCQFFVKELIYMGNLFKVQPGFITIEPLKTRCDAIQLIKPPRTPKECKMFCGTVNYLSMFCPKLQEVLKPIYGLTRKGIPYVWTEIHQKAFEDVKQMLINPPVLTLPIPDGRYILYTDTSRTHAGSALWQIQHSKPRLIGYACKSLPSAAQNYSVTELEMKGMLTGMMLWQNFLGRREFDCAVDHQAVVSIVKAKTEPPTRRIMRLLEELLRYNFKLYYVKGKDLILADYLSRANISDPEHPHDLIPITITAEDLQKVQDADLKRSDVYHLVHNQYMISTRSQYRQRGQAPPEVHGKDKALDPHKRPEQQPQLAAPAPPPPRPVDQPQQPIPQAPPPEPPPDPDYPPIMQPEDRELQDAIERAEQVQQHELVEPQDFTHSKRLEDFELDQPPLPEQVEIQHTRPGPQDFEIPPALDFDVDPSSVLQKHLPKQIHLDKVVKQLQKKVLRQTHLPLSLNTIKGHYLSSPHFRDIYRYLTEGKLPTSREKAKQVAASTRWFFILDEKLYKLNPQTESAVLCIPTTLVDLLLYWYHYSTIGAHMGITKVMETLSQRYFCPDLAKHVRAYIMGCHVCQMFKAEKGKKITMQNRVTIDTPALTRFSMDIKHMPPGIRGYHYILAMLCEVSNYLIASPLKTTQTPEVCEAILHSCIAYFGPPSHIICDQDPAFMSSLAQYFFAQHNIKIWTVGPTNHRSLKAEAGIKTLSNLLMKHLTDLGRNWPDILPLAIMSYNCFSSPNLLGHSPIELSLGRKPRIIPELEQDIDGEVSYGFKPYLSKLQEKLAYLRQRIQNFRTKRVELANQDRRDTKFTVGQLVYLYYPAGANLRTASKKICCKFIGPLVIYKAISATSFILMSLDGKIFPYLIEHTRIKPGYIQTTKGTVGTLAELRKVLTVSPLQLPPVDHKPQDTN